jgi:hypothetical protein
MDFAPPYCYKTFFEITNVTVVVVVVVGSGERLEKSA